jgi:hypothetical protein
MHRRDEQALHRVMYASRHARLDAKDTFLYNV